MLIKCYEKEKSITNNSNIGGSCCRDSGSSIKHIMEKLFSGSGDYKFYIQ